MSDFKPGDRVRWIADTSAYRGTPYVGCLGTVTGPGASPDTVTVRFDRHRGAAPKDGGWFRSRFEAVETPEPRPGDRVKVTITGTVDKANDFDPTVLVIRPAGSAKPSFRNHIDTAASGVTVEVTERAEHFAPGTVVRDRQGSYYLKAPAGVGGWYAFGKSASLIDSKPVRPLTVVATDQ